MAAAEFFSTSGQASYLVNYLYSRMALVFRHLPETSEENVLNQICKNSVHLCTVVKWVTNLLYKMTLRNCTPYITLTFRVSFKVMPLISFGIRIR